MTRFGPRVVGHHAAQKEQILRRTHGRKFGPRVIGNVLQDHHEKVAAEAAGKEADPTSRAQAKVQKAEAAAAEAKAARAGVSERGKELADVSMNIDQLEAALDSGPTMYEDLYATELARTGGPRKGGLRVLLAHELANDNRPERLEEIQKLLR